jgi:hypothetical protein
MQRATGRRRWALLRAVLVAASIGLLWILLPTARDLLIGLAMWSVVPVTLLLAAIFGARHFGDVGRFFGGGDPYDGHGPG